MITTACDQRRRVFDDQAAAQIVMQEFQNRSREGLCENLAYVVMPDHFHWLLQLAPNVDLSRLVARTKGRSAIRVNRALDSSGRLWQSGFHDHAVRHEEDIEGLANYIIHNPVRANLARNPNQYAHWWSAWHTPVRA